jgi:pentatricopeptide repeat protein
MNGRAPDALALLDRMEREDADNVRPNGVTMLAILSSCAHRGLVEEGMACFERMTVTYSLQPRVEHLSCVVDMLARMGDLEGAAKVIEERMMCASSSSLAAAWSALLSACRSHGDCEVGRDAACRVLMSMSMPGGAADEGEGGEGDKRTQCGAGWAGGAQVLILGWIPPA